MSITQNSYLNQYLDSCMQLIKTLVVKFDEAPLLINEAVAKAFGQNAVDTSNPGSWKYYMNISGEYHPTDQVMTVVSIDNLEVIEFSKENLLIHTATKKAHELGSPSYQRLLLRYPDQKAVINGILTPVDKQAAIEAESGTILGYPDHLVEPNETSLLVDLEKHIKLQIDRWHNSQFAVSDMEYCTSFWTVLSVHLLPVLLNLRLARCKTQEAHSFHVRMYLASHGELDRYLPQLTLKQSLWLYRNINFLERNHGKNSQFGKLVSNLLTQRGIPIGSYAIRHTDEFTDKLLPGQTAFLQPLNQHTLADKEVRYSVDVLLKKEIPESPGNSDYIAKNGDEIEESFRVANSAQIQTKVLESSMMDYTNAIPEPFELVALREWFSLSKRGWYEVVINFKDPSTGEARVLFAHDAFLYCQYLLLKGEGLVMETVPQYLNLQQRIIPKPTVEDLLSVVDQKRYDFRRIAQEIVDRQPDIQPMVSITAFNKLVLKLTEEAKYHQYLISSMGDPYGRAMVENMVLRLYEDVRQDYNTDTNSMKEWLGARGLPDYNYTYQESLLIVKTIYETATGLEVGSTSTLRNIQAAMIAIVKQLSSYALQFVTDIVDDDIVLINWPATRTGDLGTYGETSRIQRDGMGLVSSESSVDSYAEVKVGQGDDGGGAAAQLEQSVTVEPMDGDDALAISESVAPILFKPWSLILTYEGQNVPLEQDQMLPGYTTFHNLPESARVKLKSRYSQTVV